MCDIQEQSFTYSRNETKIEEESRLDGFYIVRTSLDKKTMSEVETVSAYKSLAYVERAFRSLKQIDLKVRPIYHRLDDRIRAHVFLCKLAYYVEWHLRQRIKPLIFEDEDRAIAEVQRESIVAPAPRSEKAKAKDATRRSEDGWPIHSFQTLLDDMGTLCLNRVRAVDRQDESVCDTFMVRTQATNYQAHVLKLAGINM